MMGGGALMVIASFLTWGGDTSGLSLDARGLLGILTLIFGAAILAVAAIRMFSPSTSLPAEVVGFSLDKILVILAASVFLWTFGHISASGVKFGIHLTWIGAALAAVGGVLTMQDRSAPAASA